MRRRDFLARTGAVALGTWFTTGSGLLKAAFAGNASVVSGAGPYGALQAADANGIMLPAGFTSRVVAESGFQVGSTGYVWHGFPDGGAVFPQSDHSWVYTSNAEIPLAGGAGALHFDPDGNVIDAYSILSGTSVNCAGGATPWGTWLSCEEFESGSGGGHVFECDPLGVDPSVMHPALGGFSHEAAAFDHDDQRVVYLTEDRGNGGFYRYTGPSVGDLTNGVLEIAQVVDDGSGGPGGDVVWHVLPAPDPDFTQGDLPTRQQVAESTPFNGGEGIVWVDGIVYFTTKGDNRVWAYDIANQSICVFYDAALDPGQVLTGVDNITASIFGDLYVAEDGGNMEIVVLSRELEAAPFLRILNQANSEIAGPAFDPSQRRLYFSSQRGGALSAGITYEVSGPFRHLMGCS